MEEELNINQDSESVESIDVNVSVDSPNSGTVFQQSDTPPEPINIEQPEIPVPFMRDYNGPIPPGRDYVPEEETVEEFGTCDCRSECKYNTGHTHKYADYGYSD